MRLVRIVLASMIVLLLAGNIKAQEKTVSVFQAAYERAMRYNDRAEAKSNLYKLISMDPQNDSLMTTLAYLYFEARQYASNVLVCLDILAINPENTAALEMAGTSYESLGLKDKALENFEKLYLISEDYQILYRMAFLQYDLKKFHQCSTNVDILLQAPDIEEATVYYSIEDEEKEFPIKVPLLNLKGLVNKELGDPDAARANFQEALNLAPDFIYAKQNLDGLDEN